MGYETSGKWRGGRGLQDKCGVVGEVAWWALESGEEGLRDKWQMVVEGYETSGVVGEGGVVGDGKWRGGRGKVR